MPNEYSEEALRSAYNNAATHMAPMNAQIALNGQVSVADHSIIHTSSMSPLSFVFGLFSQADMPYTKFSMADPEWHNFVVVTGIPALAVLVLGVFMCIWLLLNLCCDGGKRHKGLKERPSTWHLKWTTVTGFLLLYVCIGICIGRGKYAYDLIYGSVVELQEPINFISTTIGELQPGFHNAAIWLEDWQKSCIGWEQLEPMLGNTIREVNKKYTSYASTVADQMYTLEGTTRHLPELVSNTKVRLDYFTGNYKVPVGVAVFAPTILASAVVLFIVFMTLCEGKNPRMARITNFLVLDCGAVPIILVILLMTVISASFMYAGTALGGFCWEPQHNTVNLVSSLRNGTRNTQITTLVQFYVEGPPSNNTIVETMRTVQTILDPIDAYMMIIGPALDLLGMLCNRVGSSDLASLIKNAIPDIKQIVPLSERDRVYAFYDDIVIRGLCGQLTSAIGWYMICQIFCGMVLLPIIAVESHKYLSYVAEETAKKKKQEESEALIYKTAEEAKQRLQSMKPQNFWTSCMRGGGREVGVSPMQH